MKGAAIGFGITAAAWGVLVTMYSLIELARGHVPFEMLQWELGGKFITFVVLTVLILGTIIGYTSQQIRQKQGRW